MTRIIRKALAAALATGMLVLGTGTAEAATHHQHTMRDDAKMCAAFNVWANRDQQGDAVVWARYLPGTDTHMYADGESFAWAIKTHAPPVVMANTFIYVWGDCNPDA